MSIRSAERRRWAADLTGPGSGGLVIYGMGGIGKSILAAQIVTRVSRLQSDRVITVVNGEVPASAPWPADTDLVVLDNFDDNLSLDSGRWTVRDPALAARLAGWTGKLLITCRRPFSLGETPQARLTFRRLGPLTLSGAAELTTSLPAIRLLGDAERDQVWRLTAGHPLAMEYLDLLLARGDCYQDLARRIEAAITAGTGIPRTEPTELPDATAEQIASAAGDLMSGDLFGRLGTAARSLLIRASVFRVPVTAEALAARPGPIAECEAAGLLTIGPGHELGVHRWTAGALHRRLAEAGLSAQLAAAHRQAAAYWLSRGVPSPETGYHQRKAAELTRVAGPAPRPGPSLRRRGAALALAAVSVVLAVEAGRALAAPHLAAAERPARAAPAVPAVTAASATRDQAAAWVAGQVSGGAILACDPAMCAALAQRGIPAGNLLVLGPGSGDPLGSAVVVETAAVRNIFGDRLAGVYAPEVLARFGTGAARVDVRIVAPDGSAAYRRALAADIRARRAAGDQLLRSPRITVTPSARAALAAGQVDARLLITLAALAASEQVRIEGFVGRGPGESPGRALRTAEIAAPAASARRMLAFIRAQRSPYLATRADLNPGTPGPDGYVLTIEFGAPAPLGMLR
ncbi:MAG TPA: hypothetical protein VK594_07285 [Streptosporangiaceae bacterium]|nr:hypothetical protein [Streptosporangiaceae bacterium]